MLTNVNIDFPLSSDDFPSNFSISTEEKQLHYPPMRDDLEKRVKNYFKNT